MNRIIEKPPIVLSLHESGGISTDGFAMCRLNSSKEMNKAREGKWEVSPKVLGEREAERNGVDLFTARMRWWILI